MADVRLVDLEVIKRFSLAVRRESAPADEILAVLDASREAVLAEMAAAGERPRTAPRTSAAPGTRRTPAAPAARSAKSAGARKGRR